MWFGLVLGEGIGVAIDAKLRREWRKLSDKILVLTIYDWTTAQLGVYGTGKEYKHLVTQIRKETPNLLAIGHRSKISKFSEG